MLLMSSFSTLVQAKAHLKIDQPILSVDLLSELDLPPSVGLDDVTFADDFASQLDDITSDFKNHFDRLKSLIQQDPSNATSTRYYSHIQLEGGIMSYIEADSFSGRTVFHTDYPGSTVAEFTLSNYDILKANVDYVTLSCCALEKQREIINGTKRSQAYTADVVTDPLTQSHLTLVIEVSIIQGPTVGGVGNETIVWVPVIEIYGK